MLSLTLWIIAIVLALFGIAFVLLGLNSERGYWAQRDPSGDARREATPLRAIIAKAGHYAAGEYRAPLRVAAIGVLMVEIAVVAGIIALVVGLLA